MPADSGFAVEGAEAEGALACPRTRIATGVLRSRNDDRGVPVEEPPTGHETPPFHTCHHVVPTSYKGALMRRAAVAPPAIPQEVDGTSGGSGDAH